MSKTINANIDVVFLELWMDGIMDGLLQWMELFTNYYYFSGYNWASIGDPNTGDDSCDCENEGMCWPLVEAGTRCVCQPGYTGPRCGDLVTRCGEEPCRHGGNCTELGPGEGFRCECGGTGHSGEFCHIEDNCCAGQTCNSDGATCLGESVA